MFAVVVAWTFCRSVADKSRCPKGADSISEIFELVGSDMLWTSSPASITLLLKTSGSVLLSSTALSPCRSDRELLEMEGVLCILTDPSARAQCIVAFVKTSCAPPPNSLALMPEKRGRSVIWWSYCSTTVPVLRIGCSPTR